jgi:hypothetical protein
VRRGFDCATERWADEGRWRAVAIEFVVIESDVGDVNMHGLTRKFDNNLFVTAESHSFMCRLALVPLAIE